MRLKYAAYFASTLAPLSLLAALSGCTSVAYYGQSVVGHSKLMLARRSVDKLIPNAEQPLKAQLELSQSLRIFAAQQLGLPDSKSYSSYVALKRDFPVWNVVAAPRFSLEAKQWCYPVIGCASYRGYFKQAAAQRYASKLQGDGYETIVGGASAYSTLGWFSDPLLPSMMRYGDTDLAETLFHELAHQQLYINGDSDFNEAFATVVGEQGAQRWLKASRPTELAAYQAQLTAREQFYALLEHTKNALQYAYASSSSDAAKQAQKQRIFSTLKQDYATLREQQWGGKPLFDGWFEQELNNARLAAFSTYRQRVPELLALLERCENSLPRFYQRLSSPEKIDDRVVIPQECN